MKNLKVLDAEMGNGTIINFVSQQNININNKLSIVFNGIEHYFDIKSIKTNNNEDELLYITAVETGSYRMRFDKMKEFDLRNILGLQINIITDDHKIRNIKKLGCLC